jgi:2-polyprenyl-3-methyl-5-hydroxy-6-metoxy-1,4-benzoquinol methylase
MSRFQIIMDFVEQVAAEKQQYRILDIGCAQGNYTLTLSKKYEVIGIDIRSDYIEYALMKKEPSEDAIFLSASAEYLPLKNNSFDLIVCSELIEHIADPEKMIREAKRLLKSNGSLIVSTPNGNCIRFIFYRSFKDILGIPIYERKRILYTAYKHVFAFRERELESLLETCGLQIIMKKRLCSLALGQSLPWNREDSNRTPSRVIWLPEILRFIPLKIIMKLEERVNQLPLLGSSLARDLLCVCKKN